MAHKVKKTGLPAYLARKMRGDFPYRTRQATTGAIRFSEEFFSRKALNHNSFRYRATVGYNRIPGEIREARSLQAFKTKLKSWVKTNIPMT